MFQGILNAARHYTDKGFFTLGLEGYMNYFQEVPVSSRDTNSENEFVDLLCDLEIVFNDTSGMEELMKCFLCALHWFPNNSKLHNKFGSILMKNGDSEQGLQYILRAYNLAIKCKESCLAIESNILHIVWSQVPRWHYRMLNGKLRNESYKLAIHKRLDEGFKNVVDIGSGCGLLSLFAGQHNSQPKILAFESNHILHNISEQLMSKHCQKIDYKCYEAYSYLMDDIPEINKDLLVTEIFDVAVFGEGILQSLSHAFRSIMQEKDFSVVPAAATLYVTGINCKNFDMKYRLHTTISPLHIEDICLTKFMDNDPYDAESLERQDYEVLTDTVEIVKVEFTDKDFLQKLFLGEWNSTINLKGLKSGVIDCLVVWFDLHLDDDVLISTNPKHTKNEPCWEQAIFHCEHPIQIKENESISFNVVVRDEHLIFKLKYGPLIKEHKCFFLNENSITFLNDKSWIEYITLLADFIPENPKLNILEFCDFPLLGLLLAKKGHKVRYIYKKSKDIIFIKYLLKVNNIRDLHFTFVEHGMYPQYASGLPNKIDYVISEPVCQDGSLKASPMDNIFFKKYHMKYIFEEVIIHFMMIYSPYLDYCNKVNGDNVKPFNDIATELNLYSGFEHPWLQHNFPHEKMTNEQMWKPVEHPCKVETLRAIKDGQVNGILIWYTLVDTFGGSFCTKESSYYNKNVLLLPERKIETGEVLKILCEYEHGGFFKIQICEEMWLRTNLERFSNNYCFSEYLRKKSHDT